MPKVLRHRRLVIGTTVLAFAAAGGGAYAATRSSDSNPQQAFLNDVAKRLHVSPQKLTAAIKAAMSDRLNADVKAGRLTPAQAKALKQHLQQRGGAPFFGAPPFFGGPPFFFGPFGPRGFPGPPALGPGRLPGPPLFFFPGPFAGAATYLGLTQQQLFSEFRSGKSLAQIAKAKGKSVSGLEKAMTAPIKSKLDKAVSSGTISRAEEQKMLAALASRINALVNGEPRQLKPSGAGPMGPWSRGPEPPGAPSFGFGPPPGPWSQRFRTPPGPAFAPAPTAPAPRM